MARPRVSRAKAAKHPARIRRLLLSGVYLLAVAGLVAWELRDRFEEIDASCPPDTKSVERSSLYATAYRWLFSRMSEESVNQVSVVVFPEDLSDINSNICMGRAYLADVVRLVAAQNPSEIVIDRYFGTASCKELPQDTAALVTAVQSVRVPVVLGSVDAKAEDGSKGACLTAVPQLDFHSPNVHHGSILLNVQLEKIPMQWQVLPSEEAGARPERTDSLAWAAVKAYDPAYVQRGRIQNLVNSHRQPFVNLNFDLPRQTSTQLICSAGTPALQKRWSVECAAPPHAPNLLGKVVVIGTEGQPDIHDVLGRRMWGVDLQARYIQALLSGRYLRAISIWASFAVFGVYIFLIEGLPTLLEAFTPDLRKHPVFTHAFSRRRYLWVIFCAAAVILAVSISALVLGYLPPLAAFGDVLLIAITRLLIFTVESAELPLVHIHEPQPKGHL